MQKPIYQNAQWIVTPNGDMYARTGIHHIPRSTIQQRQVDFKAIVKNPNFDILLFMAAYSKAYEAALPQPTATGIRDKYLERAKRWKQKMGLYPDMAADPFCEGLKMAA